MYTIYTIGELAKILGVTAETIRYYERKNIIQPVHDENSGYRYYTAVSYTHLDVYKRQIFIIKKMSTFFFSNISSFLTPRASR